MLNRLFSRASFLFLVFSHFVMVAGCATKPPPPPEPVSRPAALDYSRPLPEGQVALIKVSSGEYPDFSRCLGNVDPVQLRLAAQRSLAYLSRPSSARAYPYLDIDHARAVATANAMIALIDAGIFSLPPEQFNQRIADTFDVYQSVGAPRPDGSGYSREVLFTGYFTPTYDASLTQTGEFQWPLFKRPRDLVSDPGSDTAGRTATDGSVVPYLDRRQIESGGLAGQELVWLNSRWNAYVITIQGSARLRLSDGRIMEVGYAGNNGYAYRSPGAAMIADGVMSQQQQSFSAMRQYFAAHPEAMDRYLWQNPRTVFFKEEHGGPFGCLNVPVTALCSLATDKAVYPAAMPAFLSLRNAADPSAGAATSTARFAFDQDRGGAIRSAGRADIYMGIGQTAEQTAGYQLSAGRLYYLAAKAAPLAQASSR